MSESAVLPKKSRNQWILENVISLSLALLLVFMIRSSVIEAFKIPSGSMIPTLLVGDHIFVNKFAYGVKIPFSDLVTDAPIYIYKRDIPKRGDIIVFQYPRDESVYYIKRVIGLPGDTVQMIGGQLHLNGVPVPKVKIADFVIRQSSNTTCVAPEFEAVEPNGIQSCHYPQYRETLPGGKTYNVLDLGYRPQDDTPPVVVPAGHVFLMGDNRDNSMDSRFPAVEGGGIGLVPQDNLIGRATIVMWSTDGSANWFLPWTWFTALRANRIGGTF